METENYTNDWKRLVMAISWQMEKLQFERQTYCIIWGTKLLLYVLCTSYHTPGGSDSKESACNAGDRVQSLGQEDPLEKGTAAHSSILAWRILWTEEPGRLQSMTLQKVGQDWAPNMHAYAARGAVPDTHTHKHTHTLSKVSCVDSWVILKCAWNSDVPGQVQKVPSAVLAEQILSLQLPSCTCSKVPDIQFWNNSNRSQIDSLQTTRTK